MIKGEWEKKLWRSRRLGDWLKEGQDEYAFSFSVFPIQASISPIRAGVAWQSPIIDGIGLFQITLQTRQWHPAAWMCWVYLWQQKFGFFIPFHPVFFFLSCISFSPYCFPFLSFSFLNSPCLWHVFSNTCRKHYFLRHCGVSGGNGDENNILLIERKWPFLTHIKSRNWARHFLHSLYLI